MILMVESVMRINLQAIKLGGRPPTPREISRLKSRVRMMAVDCKIASISHSVRTAGAINSLLFIAVGTSRAKTRGSYRKYLLKNLII